ncbi:MAG: PQQ-binding-like beta-propeller repeat protein [Fibrobacteres bacterium]|nr:PQQ-binding-like beta-propeller repeat protein [Fibrobacterota bacterium]
MMIKLICLLLVVVVGVHAYDVPCPYKKEDFPVIIGEANFRMPIKSDSTVIIHPASCRREAEEFRESIKKRCNVELQLIEGASAVQREIFNDRHMIVIGNLMNNPIMTKLYMKRTAFYDADFPGVGGYAIHTAPSPYNSHLKVLMVGFSRDKDCSSALEIALSALPIGKNETGAIRLLKSSIQFSVYHPDSIVSSFKLSIMNPEGVMPPYGLVGDCGLTYMLTGNSSAARSMVRGFELLLERAQKTGDWVPERWTFAYFDLSRIILTWMNVEEDSVFTKKDRETVSRVLWGLGRFVTTGPEYLKPEWVPEGDARQNHPLFLAFSQYMVRSYFKSRFNREEFDFTIPVYTSAFAGQELHYLPNDNAYGYLVMGTTYSAAYFLHNENRRFIDIGVKAKSADGLIAATDNLRQMVTFGDIGNYYSREKATVMTLNERTIAMAAWGSGDGAYQWVYRWITDGLSPLETRGLALGAYVADVAPVKPNRFTGVFCVTADTGVVRWAASRSSSPEDIGDPNKVYLDKMSMRASFDADAEYLMMSGISTLAHTHYDGNTINRLTWKKRIWLFDMDQFRPHVRNHNGLVVAYNGESGDVPSLTELVYSRDTDSVGVSATKLNNYGNADWTRYLLWRKGNFFVVIDRVEAKKGGSYRFDLRFRSRGESMLKGDMWTVKQGDMALRLSVADGAERYEDFEDDDVKRNWKDYPYGKRTEILRRTVKRDFSPGSKYDFASMLTVEPITSTGKQHIDLVSEGTYLVSADCGDGVVLLKGGNKPPNLPKLDADIVYIDRRGVFIAPDNGQYVNLPDSVIKSIIAWAKGQAANPKPAKERTFVDFGFFPVNSFKIPYVSTVSAAFEGGVVIGGTGGEVSVLRGDSLALLTTVPGGSEIGFVNSVELNGKAGKELIVSTLISSVQETGKSGKKDISDVTSISGKNRGANVFCFENTGKILWKQEILPNYDNALVTFADVIPSKTGSAEALVLATNGWKMFGLNPVNGAVLFSPFVKYHRLTGLGILTENGRSLIVPGTEYITPISVFDSKGKELWHSWEQMGSESKCKTEYMGYHLSGIGFIDVNMDKKKEIVFSTKNDRVYAVSAEHGDLLWQTNVGDEALSLITIDRSRSGSAVSIAGTSSGDIVLLDCNGKRLNSISLGSPVLSLLKVASPKMNRSDIAVLLGNGKLLIVDDLLKIRAQFSEAGFPVKRIYQIDSKEGEVRLALVGERNIKYIRHTPSIRWETRYY